MGLLPDIERLAWLFLMSLPSAFFLACPVYIYNRLGRRWNLPLRHNINQTALALFFGSVLIIIIAHDVQFEAGMSFTTHQSQDILAEPIEDLSHRINSETLLYGSLSIWSILLGVWVVGAGLKLYVLFLSALKTKHIRQQIMSDAVVMPSNKPTDVRSKPVLVSHLMDQPVVMGVFRPVIVIPEDLTERLKPAEVNALIAHERAHIDRYDPLKNLILQIVRCLFWFNIPFRYLLREYEISREYDCDRRALSEAVTSQNMASAIGHTALSVAESKVMLALGGHYSEVSGRMQQLIQCEATIGSRLKVSILLTLIALFLFSVGTHIISKRGIELSLIRTAQSNFVVDPDRFDLESMGREISAFADEDGLFNYLIEGDGKIGSDVTQKTMRMEVRSDGILIDSYFMIESSHSTLRRMTEKYGVSLDAVRFIELGEDHITLESDYDGMHFTLTARS